MFCTSCGIKNAADSNFCKQCGGKLDRAAAAKINEDAFERAMPEDEQVSALLERAYRLRKENSLEGAIALCQEILRLRDDSTSAHSLLGQLYEQQGDREGAIREYERVLHLNPGSIADRVKLDELRGQAETGSARKAQGRVVMADPHVVPGLGYARFTSAGLAIALLTLGGLLALQLRPRTVVATADTTNPVIGRSSVAVANTTVPAVPNNALNTGIAATLPETSGEKPADKPNGPTGTLSGPAAPSNAGTSSAGVNAVAANNPPASSANVSTPSAPSIIYRPGPVRYVQAPAPPASNPIPASPLPGIKPPKAGANNNNSGRPSTAGNGRVVLPGDPDEFDSNGNMIVKVNSRDVPGKKNNGGEDNGFSRIVVDKTPSGATRVVPTPGPVTTTESRSFLAVGDEKKRQRDYKGAIDAFTKSLASAGDQMGYVLQQRALCYQQLNELSSAKADYESAINEYHKLEARDPETARNGVRACERGIKSCGN